MPSLDPQVVTHRWLSIPASNRSNRRKGASDLSCKIRSLLRSTSLIIDSFIREVRYPTGLANIVPVRKKERQIRVCVDFRDLNKACPKDYFLVPFTEMMIDSIVKHEALSFMDGSSGYNQIKITPEDAVHTSFRTPKEVFCYKVMTFSLKNAGVTYQRVMVIIIGDLHKKTECYVDDLVVNTIKREDHL